MRKFICLLCAVLLLPIPFAAAAGEDPGFVLGCTSAVLMERQTGTVLYAKDECRHLPPASVTKVMTLLLISEAVDSGLLPPDEVITASPRAASMGGSQVWLKEGEQMTAAEMIKCVAVVSANDCAVALAERLCGSEESFAARMNRRAEELGMENTHFTNCTGLFEDPDHYTCALDVAIMSRELLGHDFIRQYTAIWTDAIRNGDFGLTNTNKLVRYYPGCTGLKTGFTSSAMFCLSASAMREGTEYIAVILHDETSQRRFDDARTLLDYAFANYALVTPRVEELPGVPVVLGETDSVSVVCGQGGSVVVRKEELAGLTSQVELPERIDAPVAPGQVLGTLRLMNGETVVAQAPLVAGEGAAKLGVRAIWRRLAAGLGGAEE